MTLSLPKGHLSVSQIRSYLTCAKKYEFQVVMGIRSPGGYSLLDGRAFHTALERANRAKLEDGEVVDLAEVQSYYSEAWGAELERVDDYDFASDHAKGETEQAVKDAGLQAVASYWNEYGQQMVPAMIERGVEYEIGGVRIKGYIDFVERIDAGGFIRDFKKSGASKQESIVHDSIQLVSYALAYRTLTGELEAGVGLDYVIDLKKGPKLQRFEAPGPVPDERIARFAETVDHVARGISGGIFPRDEEGMGCSWCGYREMCKGRP